MSKTFEQWFEDYENNAEYAANKIAKDAYEAGQQSRQEEIDRLKGQLAKLGFTDLGGQFMKPPLGIQPNFLMDYQKEQSKLIHKFFEEVGIENAKERLKIAKESGLDMWTYGWGFTTKQLEKELTEANINTPEIFDLEKVKARCEKLRSRYNRGGLSNTDYNELLHLEKAIEQANKVKTEGGNNGQ